MQTLNRKEKKMKKMMVITLTAVMVGGAFSYAAARPGSGGMWSRGRDLAPCYQGEDFERPCRDGNVEDGADRWWGRGRGACFEDSGSNRKGTGRFRNLDLEGIDGEVDQREEAALIVSTFLERRGNPNLKVGKIGESGRDFVVEIVTQDGSLANKVYVEKKTGRIIPAYR
jgi:hypothetical protein